MNNDTMLHWLLHRKITQAVIDRFGITTEDSIVIPIKDADGQLLFNKHRRNPFLPDTGPKYWYDSGSQAALFGIEFAKDAATVVICEGELDALVLWSLNIPAVTSTGGALTFKEDWADMLREKEVYVCLDNDEAGANGTVKILSMLPAARVIIIPEAAQVKDITDYCARGGDFRDLMASAKRYLSEEEVRADRQARTGAWQSVIFHDAWLKWWERTQAEKQAVPIPKRTGEDNVERAKQYPITALLKVNRARKALCPFHADHDPSLHVFADNHAYCFVCGKRADAIDVYRVLHNCGFKEAVEELNRL